VQSNECSSPGKGSCGYSTPATHCSRNLGLHDQFETNLIEMDLHVSYSRSLHNSIDVTVGRFSESICGGQVTWPAAFPSRHGTFMLPGSPDPC